MRIHLKEPRRGIDIDHQLPLLEPDEIDVSPVSFAKNLFPTSLDLGLDIRPAYGHTGHHLVDNVFDCIHRLSRHTRYQSRLSGFLSFIF